MHPICRILQSIGAKFAIQYLDRLLRYIAVYMRTNVRTDPKTNPATVDTPHISAELNL